MSSLSRPIFLLIHSSFAAFLVSVFPNALGAVVSLGFYLVCGDNICAPSKFALFRTKGRGVFQGEEVAVFKP